MSWLLEAHRDARTYRTASYLLAGLPLGTIAFMLVVIGMSLGFGLAVTVLGLPVLMATFLGIRAFAGLERHRAQTLLNAPMPRGIQPKPLAGTFWEGLRSLITDHRIWVETAYLVMLLPLGIMGFVFLATVFGLAISGVVVPTLIATGVDPGLGATSIDTFAKSLICIPLSVVFLLAGPRLVLGYGEFSGRLATAFLGRIEPAELKTAVADVLSRIDDPDAFRILDELEQRFGRGPFLTPIRVEATLLALESNGRIRAHHADARTSYAIAADGAH